MTAAWALVGLACLFVALAVGIVAVGAWRGTCPLGSPVACLFLSAGCWVAAAYLISIAP